MDIETTILRDRIEDLALVLDCSVYELLNILQGQLLSDEEAGEIRAFYEEG